MRVKSCLQGFATDDDTKEKRVVFSEFAVYVFMPRVLLCEADPEMPRKATTVPEDWDEEGNWVGSPRVPTPTSKKGGLV